MEEVKSRQYKILHKKFKGLNSNNVREAFGWDENFMKPGIPRANA